MNHCDGEKAEFLIASRAPLLEHRSCHDWWKSDLGKEWQRGEKTVSSAGTMTNFTLHFLSLGGVKGEATCHLFTCEVLFFYTFHTLENDVFNFASYFQGGSSLQSVFIKRWWQSLTNGISPLRCGSVLFFKFGIIRLPAIFTCCSENLSKSARLPEL